MLSEKQISTLFNAYYPSLVSLATVITKDEIAACDIADDAIIKARTTDNPNLKAFLFSVVINMSKNYLKHKNILNKNQMAYIQHELSDWHVEDPMNDIHEIDAHIIGEINAAIQELPQKCKAIFELSWIHDWPNERIAETLGVSYNTVRWQKQRALQILQQKFCKVFVPVEQKKTAKPKQYKEKKTDVALRLYNEGKNFEQISQVIKSTVSSIKSLLSQRNKRKSHDDRGSIQ